MPYIEQHQRESEEFPTTPGELNYYITRLCHEYLKAIGGVSYTHLNETIGALECAKLELYRMVAAPYEDKKKEQNGPVSELDS